MWAGAVRVRAGRGPRVRSRRWLGVLAWSLVVLLAATSCTYSKEEPGLFPQRDSPSAPAPAPSSEPPSPPEPTNPELPVVGQQTWFSADGLRLQAQLAVHAVRRMPGATVLDWSITPVRGSGLQPGDPVPAAVSLGLTRETQGDVNLFLIDPAHAKVYRPLSHRSAREFHRCLCSPVWVAQLNLRLGETRMMQVAYPALPAGVRFVDVDLTTVPPFVHVPVTAVGQVPSARAPSDLTRPGGRLPTLLGPVRFSYPPGQTRRAQSISINRVVASEGYTSLQWTITSLSAQTGFGLLPPSPPLAAELPPGVNAVSQNGASGPRLAPAGPQGPTTSAWWMTESFNDLGFLECLCTELGLWAAALREPGGQVSVTTNYPPLPAGVHTVDVVLPGVMRLPGLPVTRAADSAAASGPPVSTASREPWTYLTDNPPAGWATSDWPTPLPQADQLRDYLAVVENLVPQPR